LEEHSLIEEFEYTPANRTKFSQLYFAATPEKREALTNTLLQLQAGQDTKKIAEEIDKEIAEALLFYGYAHLDEDIDKQLLTGIKKLRLFFSAGKAYDRKQFKQKNLTSRAPIMVAANWTNRANSNGLGFVFRPAHYNQTDKPDDVGNAGKLVFLEASLFIGEKIILDSLVIVDVHKSEVGKSGLYGDDELEWGMKINYRNVYREAGSSDDLFSASGYIGDVYFVGKNTWLQNGVKGGLRNNVAENGVLFLAPTVNLTTQLNFDTRLVLSVGHEFGFYQAANQGTNLTFTGAFQLDRVSAISATYEKDLFGRTLSVSYHHYF
jgi:hypothetical protein